MKYVVEVSLENFKFWSGAADNAAQLTKEELPTLDNILEEMSDNRQMTETEINDLMWFDFENVCEWLGLDYDEVMER